MANVISTSLTWSQEDAQKYFLAPLFYENEHLKGMDVITDVSGVSILLDRYTSVKDITKTMTTATSFTADGTQSTNTNITLTLIRLEVEHAQQANVLFSHIKSQLLKKGINRADMTGTIFQEIVSEVVMQGIKRDFSTILWWGDVNNGAGTQALCNGVWKSLDLQVGVGGFSIANNRVVGTNALTNLESMLALRSNELAAMDNQLIYCSRAFADDYAFRLRAAGTHVAAYADLQDGISNLRFQGVRLVVIPSWDVDIATHGAALANMANAFAPDAVAETKCAIWTSENNITVGTDFQAQDVDMWYNKDEKENRFRMLYSMGVAVKEPLMCVASVETA
jgi:hypothetical protein